MEASFWKDCPVVESVPGKVSGLPVLKNTRVQADTIWESAELGRTPEQIAGDYRLNLSLSDVRAVLAYLARRTTSAPAR